MGPAFDLLGFMHVDFAAVRLLFKVIHIPSPGKHSPAEAGDEGLFDGAMQATLPFMAHKNNEDLRNLFLEDAVFSWRLHCAVYQKVVSITGSAGLDFRAGG